MSYIQQQRDALGPGEEFAIKIVNCTDATERPATKWLTVNADKLNRIMAIIEGA